MSRVPGERPNRFVSPDEPAISERLFQSLIETGNDVITILNREGLIAYTSPSVTAVLGYRPEDLLGESSASQIHPDDTKAWQSFSELIDAGPSAVRRAAYRRRHKDGSWRHMEATGTNLLHDPAVRGIVVSSRDVTELRHAELQIHRIVTLSPAVLFVRSLDPSCPPGWVSETIQTMLGYTPAETLAPSWWKDNLHPDDRTAALAASSELPTAGSVSHEYRFRAKDGSYRWIRDQQRVVPGIDCQSDEVVGSWIDATEFKQLESQYLHSQKMEAVGRLAGAIAHDFNNMLTAVTGHVQLMIADMPHLDPLRSELQEMQQEIDRAAALTRQLLSFSRKQVIRPEPLDLGALVGGMEGMIQRVVSERIAVSVECPQQSTWVSADRSQIEQVIVNLVVNASDAMIRSGGELFISVEPAHLSRANGEVPPGDYARLTVRDTGSGIPEDVLPLIFDPFFTTKEAGKGTGLGLATVYGVATQSHGYVSVRSVVQHGTEFVVFLPLCAEPAPVREPVRMSETSVTGSETILVVEDEDAVRKLACRILRKQGYTVIEAASGQEAVLIVNGGWGKVDLLLTDMVMPHVSGLDVARTARTVWPDIPIVIVSGYTEESIDLGKGMAFLEKPYSPTQLAAAARAALNSRPATATARA